MLLNGLQPVPDTLAHTHSLFLLESLLSFLFSFSRQEAQTEPPSYPVEGKVEGHKKTRGQLILPDREILRASRDLLSYPSARVAGLFSLLDILLSPVVKECVIVHPIIKRAGALPGCS